MNYQDFVYGQTDIDEPVLIELMSTAAMQRLKGILQHGITGFLGITTPITRFEHSVGAMLLARHFKTPVNEQIAALLSKMSDLPIHWIEDVIIHSKFKIFLQDNLKESWSRFESYWFKV